MFFRMNREEMAGENLREGNMEVAFELWIERRTAAGVCRRIRIQVDSNGDFHRYRESLIIGRPGGFPCIVLSAEVSSEFRWYHGHYCSP